MHDLPSLDRYLRGQATVEEYWGWVLANDDIRRELVETSPFHARLAEILLDGLRRLDAVPRNDPLWKDTNRAATVGKLGHLVHREPTDPRSLLLGAALDVWRCDNDFGADRWESLILAGEPILDLAFESALHLDAASGTGRWRLLELLERTGTREAARAWFGQAAAERKGAEGSIAAEIVRDLDGP